MGEHVVGGDQISLTPGSGQPVGQSCSEEFLDNLDAPGPGGLRRVVSRLNALAGNFQLFDILQQVTVIGGYFRDQTVGSKAEAVPHVAGIGSGMVQPCL